VIRLAKQMIDFYRFEASLSLNKSQVVGKFIHRDEIKALDNIAMISPQTPSPVELLGLDVNRVSLEPESPKLYGPVSTASPASLSETKSHLSEQAVITPVESPAVSQTDQAFLARIGDPLDRAPTRPRDQNENQRKFRPMLKSTAPCDTHLQ